MATLSQIRQQFEQISGEYDARFAGQSRITRSLEDINNLTNRLRTLANDLAKLPRGKERDELATSVKDQVLLFENERKEIMKAKSLGGEATDFDALRTEANLVFAQYHRHFAGKSRNTRDLGLLAEMIEDLERIEEEMVELLPKVRGLDGAQQDVDVVRSNMAMYRTERGEIVEARGMGTPDEQASALAEMANAQFKVYDTHFAGKARATRRPELLQRVIDNLVQIQDRMRSLEGNGVTGDYNKNNIGIVEDSLGTYRTELVEIQKARQGRDLPESPGRPRRRGQRGVRGVPQGLRRPGSPHARPRPAQQHLRPPGGDWPTDVPPRPRRAHRHERPQPQHRHRPARALRARVHGHRRGQGRQEVISRLGVTSLRPPGAVFSRHARWAFPSTDYATCGIGGIGGKGLDAGGQPSCSRCHTPCTTSSMAWCGCGLWALTAK